MRHLNRKRPTGRGSFSWGRVPEPDRGMVVYRLFRRDLDGVAHYESHAFKANDPRADIARTVRQMRHILRDRVDELDLATLGVTA